jgi:hypothetical protein
VEARAMSCRVCGVDLEEGFCPGCDQVDYDCKCESSEPLIEQQTSDDLSALLDDVERFERRFISFGSSHQSATVALWVAHCYAIEAAFATLYLRIKSAAPESGKSTLLEVQKILLGDNALDAVSISPSAVFRTRDKIGPVALLLDEVDNTVKNRTDENAKDLLALVNAGYRRGARVYRTVGKDFEPRAFNVFGPAAIAGIGHIHPATESRAVPIQLDRRPRGGKHDRFISFLIEPEAAELRQRLSDWASEDVVEKLRHAAPDAPDQLSDRQVEGWWALFNIADLAGGEWPTRARMAATVLHGSADSAASQATNVLLLSHIRQAFEELIRHLADNEEGPWGRWWSSELNKEGTPRAAAADLARHLGGFKKADGDPIKPKVLKFPDGTTARGYHVEDFADAFKRYLSPSGGGDVTHVTDVTPLASTVTSVTSVTSGGPTGVAAKPPVLVDAARRSDGPARLATSVESEDARHLALIKEHLS